MIQPGLELPTPLLQWEEMWKVLKQHVGVATPAVPVVQTAPAPAAGRRHDRQALGASTSAAAVNLVTHPGYTEIDRRLALAGEKGCSYVADHIDCRKSYFLIELEHLEGEFSVGLGRRTFDAELDDAADGLYEIEWFERKNKRTSSWGFQPGFKLTVESYTSQRKPISQTSIESIGKFLPIVVSVAPSSKPNEPTLTKDTLNLLRSHQECITVCSADEDDVVVGSGKQRNKRNFAAVVHDSDDE